jgi:hypothetical protein
MIRALSFFLFLLFSLSVYLGFTFCLGYYGFGGVFCSGSCEFCVTTQRTVSCALVVGGRWGRGLALGATDLRVSRVPLCSVSHIFMNSHSPCLPRGTARLFEHNTTERRWS